MKKIMLLLLISFVIINDVTPQRKSKKSEKADVETKKSIELQSSTYSGLKWRSVGPAYVSGRIADFAVNPKNHSEWYVAVASGNIWKTTNNGHTFSPIFDNYGSYSIGALALDPTNHNIIWAGTGENNHQRALGYGDGVYKSLDGGKSWKNMGLKESRQIGMICIDPRNTNTVFVAAEGSAWGGGGERGLYKTTDGGENWKKVLNISENTGVNNVIIDPENPDIMYATSEQRRRHVHTKIGGGPESAIYKSTDAGENWRKLSSGLPSGHVGGMGIAVSPVNTNYVYAIIEAEGSSGGFFRSTNKGESWHKMSPHTSSGQYYNEIYCDPLDVNKIYSVETVSHVSNNGGKTWKPLSTKSRHVDDHALWIDPSNTKHFIIGGDGGIYDTYDGGKNYRHIPNLPVTQFYRVYVDNDTPFYNVYGGTQDNNSIGGPSRNTSSGGVTSGEWINTVGGDGFWGMVDPKNPDIVYSEYQYGNVYRYDKKTGEKLYIKPQVKKGDLTYRWNWNAPFVISKHNNKRLYIAANKVFKSDDRGRSWKAISSDLTANIDRNTWAVMGKYWSSDAVQKDLSTSLYGTIVSFAESPISEKLLYVGTDDGLIQTTVDGGKSWTKQSNFSGVPAHTYVSDICPSKFNENIVFASFDNLKRDDFKPYIYKSTDKGKTWTSIANDLPKNGTVHTIAQDSKNPNLLFVGTEFGIFFSHNGGKNWIQLKSGIPTIAVRDIAIQERENDLILATFGRGIYILDDYSPLRQLSGIKDINSKIFNIKDALAYIQTGVKYGQGACYYIAKNPEFGAVFSYYIKEVPKSAKSKRKDKEKKLFKDGKPIAQLSLSDKHKESMAEPTYLQFTIKDENGNIVRKLRKAASKGINRINWDLRYAKTESAAKTVKKFDPLKKLKGGFFVMPGKYTVSLGIYENGNYKKLCDDRNFIVKQLNNSTIPNENPKELRKFQQRVSKRVQSINATFDYAKLLHNQLLNIKQTVIDLPKGNNKLMKKIQVAEAEIDSIIFAFEGYKPQASFEELPPHKLAINKRVEYLMWTHYNSMATLTKTEQEQLAIIEEKVPDLINKLKKIKTNRIDDINEELDKINAPWTPGRMPEWD